MIRIDLNQAVLLAAVLVTAVSLLSQWRWSRRTRQLLQRDLERIFEQVDLMRFDVQQQPATEGVVFAAPATRPTAPGPNPGYATALELAADGASEKEITARCGLSAAEARILVAMRGLRGRGRTLN